LKNLKNLLIKFESENSLLFKDMKGISEYLEATKNSKEKDNTQKQEASERNKTFSLLINQMRKATKIISVLEKRINNFKK
jgi:hypothetical protein